MARPAYEIYSEVFTTWINIHTEEAPEWKIPYKEFELAFIRAGYRKKTAFDAFCEIVNANELKFDNHFLYIN